MKIRQKLTLSFTSTVILILILFGIAVYFFSSEYRENEFYNRLVERVELTEKMFLEKDKLPKETYELIREQFLNKLPSETEEVMELKGGNSELESSGHPPEFIAALVEDEQARFEADSVQGVGKIFHLPEGKFAVILTARDHAGIRMLTYLRTILILALALCTVTLGLMSWYVSGSVLNPISNKIKRANTISAKNLHERLMVYNPDDEIGQLAIAFNNLLDRVSNAFNAQRSFIDNASHEMRNPLTAIIGEADVALEKERSKEEYVESIQSIAAEANRLNSLVNNLLHLANIAYREVPFKREPIDVQELLREAKRKFDFSTPKNRVELRNETSGSPQVMGNSHLLQTALINIFDNASKFSYNEVVDVYVHTNNDNDVIISVRDKGLGIPAEDISKVTVPFHRAPNVRQIVGTGIGIPLTVKIVELHKGRFSIKSKLNEGTEVEITLPVV